MYNIGMESKDSRPFKNQNHYVYSCKYHIVWCPKYRRKVLVNGVDARLKELIYQLTNKEGSEVLELEVMPDHVHLLVELPPSIAPLDYIKHIKRQTATILKREFPKIKATLPSMWTRSVFISTVGGAPLEIVNQYVANQKRRVNKKK